MLKGKTAVVTGASRGIGRAIALKLAKLGANIVVNYRSSAGAVQEVVKEIEALGAKALAVQCDISSYSDVENMMKKCVEQFGSLDILVNNAGITKDGLLMRMKEEDFDSVIDINLKGAFNCTRHVSAIMLKQRSGRIINISSVSGLTGNAGQVNYSAAKAGIIGMTKAVAREFASRGVTCNAVAPGYIQTDMTDSLSQKVKEAVLSGIPLKRLGMPCDVANAVAFLASEEASYITGQVINVDGGMVM
ncbi:3-oxoacyl-[acyl-carrier-protein] reductase [Clostridium tagluense]|uniref:3-oxoacyl-[acyl-carrier-protein] reductase n=1 Tax=Clostridium TaxID=1485 RepID=UPI0013E96447|nr:MULTISPECIES: 3-oxoacyl-[acyl-carrier-protein] reductase [Clostridium]MBW9156120.1 3-oxoacyl-[acyl-carrier-protein] reductase [Clostridium tagluense]MBZ9625906.1 3-oxoacyl-[acyl-carrier-protein] reductase [Clostridium sp. FP2]MCB2297910.1 3-oxoacyl-[acyl-carrier-protein] reductase [Clostridium tagluense]MCB2311261.1 3-oxoacyl-[acyl-carrier-protein] reductase [Clostridium tagluense]MCB2316097.1 3-oxoacyl-[acyl-carrier-protein] reductase [Clostridium tagluense]